jgi:hypothetical protein
MPATSAGMTERGAAMTERVMMTLDSISHFFAGKIPKNVVGENP